MASSSITRQLEILCRSEAALLWPWVADTGRLNRAAGLPPVEISPAEGPGAARHRVRTRMGPFDLEWAEHPFEWQAPRRWSVRREVLKGPVTRIDVTLDLEPRPEGGTKVTARVAIEPRSGLLRPVTEAISGTMLRRLGDAIQRFDRQVAGEGQVDHAASPAREEALSAGTGRLFELLPGSEALAERLTELLRRGDDGELARLRPFALAARWGADGRAVLELCRAAVVAGLLELSWEVVCPSCRTGADRLSDLAELRPEGHCGLCDLRFGVELDRAVEATFRPAPAVRQVEAAERCTGGPGRSPHVLAQVVLEPGGAASLPVPEAPGRLRLFARGGGFARIEVAPGGPPSAELAIGGEVEPAEVLVAPGATLHLVERSGEARHVKLERLEWASLAATAHEVATLPAWRRLFSRQALRPGLSLAVGRAAILFSDLSASTALYGRVGDAAAFRLVQDHFELLGGLIAAHQGAIVKTIGDAVMASFLDEPSAIRAGLAMQRAFPAFREAHPEAEGVFLGLGLYAGPCYAVTANGLLDYFGQSVNLAARLQGQAAPGDLVVTREAAERAQRAGLLEEVSVSEPFEARLKGIEAPVPLVRLRVPHSPPG